MRVTVLLLALASAFTFAADNSAIAPQSATNLQSTVVGHRSPVIDGAEAITIPQMLSYQGKLTDTLGQPVQDTLHAIRFRLYVQPTGGTQFWEENQQVMTQGGLFSVLLGSVTPIGSVPAAGALYLGMAVAGGAELSPRLRIASAAYAYKADTANYALAGAGGGGTVTSIGQATGVVCNPNPITTTGTVRFDSTWGDGRFVRNQNSTAQSGNFWVAGCGRAANFYGVTASAGVPGVHGDGGTYGPGVYGQSASTSYPGLYGSGESATDGVFGYANTSNYFGVRALNGSSSGTGVAGSGNNQEILRVAGGSGVAGTGLSTGVYGHARSVTGPTAGGYFDNGYGSYTYVGYYSGTTNYKVAGSGTVSTVMQTREGRKSLFAPEMPEAHFEDCGEGQLADGHCRVDLEKLFSDCITVDAEHPLKVFVQLEDDCSGVYVKKDTAGFDVYELQGGKSNARFSWRALAKWKGNEDTRLPDGPGPLPTVAVEHQPPVEGKAAPATTPQSVPGQR